MHHWMLFKQESTGDHYLWNGTLPICVRSADEHLPVLEDINPAETTLLNTAATTPKVRSLKLRKTRYNIVAKGVFVDA